MRYATAALLLILLCGLGMWLCDSATAGVQTDACPIWRAEHDVRIAERALANARHRLSEARRVLSETRRASEAYGSRTGRWVRLARRAGWPWAEIRTLMRIIDAESGGVPYAVNAYSGCSGLLQLHPCHWTGRYDPLVPRLNLRGGLRLWRGSGWQPWVTW